jgi:DNA-binding response OmpR family regulator
MRILVAEDEPKLNELISAALRKEHYEVDSAYDGNEALDCFSCAEYDVAIFDVMMPGCDGFEAVRRIRERGIDTPVLFLTAKDGVRDRIHGLDIGGDDYLVKPFVFEELLARVRALIRRSSGGVSNVFTAANLTLDADARTVYRGDVLIDLTNKEFAILEYMMRNEGVVLTRERINNHMWNYDYDGTSNIVDVYIRYIRKKIDDSFTPKLLHTIRGVGYVLRVNP